MMGSLSRRVSALMLSAIVGAGCASGAARTAGPGAAGATGGIDLAPGVGVQPIEPADGPLTYETSRLPHTEADVHFMTGMIAHHAQAVLMAGWAPTHGARDDIRVLCERIIVAQRDEIRLMQNWLRDVGEPVPDAEAMIRNPGMHAMPGMEHQGLMPGMLTADELARLDAARGSEFDRLFLTFMIRHHQGAVTMVDELFGSRGAAQDEKVFRMASDIYADQTTEIDRMQRMLAAMVSDDATREQSPPSLRF